MTGKAGGGGKHGKATPLSGAPPLPSQKPLAPAREVMQVMEKMMGRVEEASKLEAVGRSPPSSPTRQLAQMAAEAGPSALGGSLPEGSSVQLLEAKPHKRNS